MHPLVILLFLAGSANTYENAVSPKPTRFFTGFDNCYFIFIESISGIQESFHLNHIPAMWARVVTSPEATAIKPYIDKLQKNWILRRQTCLAVGFIGTESLKLTPEIDNALHPLSCDANMNQIVATCYPI